MSEASSGAEVRQREAPRLVSVVIPARNASRYLGAQLESLADQDYDGLFEVVVADNGSDDDTSKVAKTFAGRLDLTVVDVPTPRGTGVARNAGVAVAGGELLAFIDADDVASSGWLTAIVRAALHFDLVGGPYELRRLNSPEVQSWRTPRPFDHLPISHGFLAYAAGGNLAVWREVFDDVGGFDRGFSQDVSFSWTAQAKGWRLGFAHEAFVHYRWRETIRATASQHYRWGYSEMKIEEHFRTCGLRQRSMAKDVLEGAKHALTLPLCVFDRKRTGWRVARLAYLLGRVRGRWSTHRSEADRTTLSAGSAPV